MPPRAPKRPASQASLLDGDSIPMGEAYEDLRGAPLAARMRPRTFDDYVGQEHLVGPGRLLRRLVENGQLPSIILWGPPGSGKTTLARIIAAATDAHFVSLSAVSAGVADIRRVMAEARARKAAVAAGAGGLGSGFGSSDPTALPRALSAPAERADEDSDSLDPVRAAGLASPVAPSPRRESPFRTVLFIDEIHRFNKAQQDAVLPYVEDGTVTLIGATTENPSFEVIGPLLSRCRVFTLKALEEPQLVELLRRALIDAERGLGALDVSVDDDALEALAASIGGDARIGLNALEASVMSVTSGRSGVDRRVTREVVEEALQHRTYLYDRQGDSHYDTISAFIKSLRGSSPDGALYWLARMVEAGEDPLFIVRRMVILASEDVGLADPNALSVAIACQQAVHFIGMPEGFYPLAECALYLALAPKSNSVGSAYTRALADVEATRNDPVPMHLRNAVTGLMRGMGYGKGYQYAHDFDGGVAPEQTYLPERLKGRKYYLPRGLGKERELATRHADAERNRPSPPPPQTYRSGSPHNASSPAKAPPAPSQRPSRPVRED